MNKLPNKLVVNTKGKQILQTGRKISAYYYQPIFRSKWKWRFRLNRYHLPLEFLQSIDFAISDKFSRIFDRYFQSQTFRRHRRFFCCKTTEVMSANVCISTKEDEPVNLLHSFLTSQMIVNLIYFLFEVNLIIIVCWKLKTSLLDDWT